MQVVQKELPSERVAKVIARAGIASRREVERMIMQKRVKVNGIVLDGPAINVTTADHIEVDGNFLREAERTRLWLYYKPAGLVTTHSDPEGRPTVFDNLPTSLSRVVSIGRLDINTEGLLLLTNDGQLSRILELPVTGWLRVYRVRAYGKIDQSRLDELREGIALQGVFYGGIQAIIDSQKGSNIWLKVSLREGKNREIKKVFESLNLEVNRLIRISYGPFQLGELTEGSVKEVSGKVLRDQLGPKLLEKARVNFDAPIYSSETVIQEGDNTALKHIRKSINYLGKDKKHQENDKFSEREYISPSMRRRNRASNVWMAQGSSHASSSVDRRKEEDNQDNRSTNYKGDQKGKYFNKKEKASFHKKGKQGAIGEVFASKKIKNYLSENNRMKNRSRRDANYRR
ncbi:rRNA pseudouridine synthase [Liberibacter sp. Z1]|nr:rRNA pseudouridine synthase [Candidatus Liberibacter sp.]